MRDQKIKNGICNWCTCILFYIHLLVYCQIHTIRKHQCCSMPTTDLYDGRKVTTYTTHQWHVVLEVFCVVYVGKPPTLHCVVGGLPTCCCWFTNNNMLLLVYQHVVVGLPTCCCRFTNNNMLLLVYQHVVVGLPTTTCCCWFTNMLLLVFITTYTSNTDTSRNPLKRWRFSPFLMRGFPKRNIIFARDDCTTLFIVDQAGGSRLTRLSKCK